MRAKVTREEAYHRLTDLLRCKWTLAILGRLTDGPQRPSQLERALDGLTPKVLNDRLTKLMRYGLVCRHTYDETPPRAEYGLTPRGRSFVAMLAQLRSFAEAWATDSDEDAAQERREETAARIVTQPSRRRPLV